MRYELLPLLLSFILSYLEAHKIVEEATQDHVAWAECALLVTERFISTKTNTVVIQEKCHDCEKELQNFNCRILDHYLQQLQIVVTLQLFFGRDDVQPWNYNIFIVDTVLGFRDLRLDIPDTWHEREFYFIVIFTHQISDWKLRSKHMMAIFKMCIFMKVINVVILYQEPELDNSIGFYTFSMAGSFCGTSIRIELVNRYRNGKLEQDFLFPPTLRDFYGCIINVTAHISYPLLTYNSKHNQVTNHTGLMGFEGDLLKILSKALNFTIHLDIPSGRSDISHNYSNSTGCFRLLETKKAEIAIGGFSSLKPNSSKFSYSIPYYQTQFVFVVRTGRWTNLGPLMQLANPFCTSVWATIGLTFVLTFVLFKFIQYFKDPRLQDFILGAHSRYPNTNMLTIFLGNPINRPPRRNFARFMLMCWLLATLILRNAYQGKLFDSLRVSRRISTPKTIKELIDGNYFLFSSGEVHFYPRNMTVVMANMGDRYRMVQTSNLPITTVSLLDTLAFYNWRHWNTSNLAYVEEPIYMFQLVMYFQKHSLLKLIIDNKLQQLMSAGIVSHLAKSHGKAKYQAMNSDVNFLPSISNDMLTGLYILYAILMGVSVIYFLLELLSVRVKILQRLFISTGDTHGQRCGSAEVQLIK